MSIVLNVIFVLLFVWRFIYPDEFQNRLSKSQELLPTKDEFPFLSQRIFFVNKNDQFINFVPLRQALQSYASQWEDKMGIYFEYLPSGSSIGINATNELEMASLFKIPTVMMIYQKISKGEIKKNTVLSLQKKQIDKTYGTFWQKGVGTTITVEEAINKTLIDSDNTTYLMLYELLSREDRTALYSHFDIRVEPHGETQTPFISPKSYASVLKSLYISSYLEPNASNEIITILTKGRSFEGITSVIPEEIPVARKTGTIQSPQSQDVHNDCGIVYYPKRPYILCVFLLEEDRKKALNEISKISQFVFSFVRDINNTEFEQNSSASSSLP